MAGSVAWEAAGRRLAGSGRYHGGWGPVEYQAHGVAEISAAPESFGTWTNGVAGGERACASEREKDRIGAWMSRDRRLRKSASRGHRIGVRAARRHRPGVCPTAALKARINWRVPP